MASYFGLMVAGAMATSGWSSYAHAQVLLTTSLTDWQAAVGNNLNVTGDYKETVTKLGSGSVQYPTSQVLTVNQWGSWCCGYNGEVLTNGPVYTSITLAPNNLVALGVQVEPESPNDFDNITVTLSNGQNISADVSPNGGAQFFGFVGSGITSLTIVDNAGQSFAFGNFYATPLPTSEKTASVGWDNSGGEPTVHEWEQTLLPTTTSFVGESVQEAVGGPGSDTCWFKGSAVARFTKITGGTWDVTEGNQWGYDYVGWKPHGVIYYRDQGRAPCGATIYQQMTIAPGSGGTYFDYGLVNTLQALIGLDTVTSVRAGKSATRDWK